MSILINRFKKWLIDINEKLNKYRSYGGVIVKLYFGIVNKVGIYVSERIYWEVDRVFLNRN